MRRILATVAASLIAAAGPLSSPAAHASVATQNINPSTLPRGAAPNSDYLVGRSIFPATGGRVRLPGSWNPAKLTLVGHSTKGWLVQREVGAESARLYRVTRSSVRQISKGSNFGSGFIDWYLASDDRHVVRYSADGYGGCWLKVLDLTGKVLAHHGCAYDGNYVGASANTVWYSAFGSPGMAWKWATSGPTSIGVHGELADPAHDVLFVRPRSRTQPGGPTSLSHPGAPTWRAAFQARAVSPNGAYVVGRAGNNGTGDVEIRRMSDGALVRRFHVGGAPWFGDIWWESNRNVLFGVSTSRTWLVRCSTAGSCHRAGGPVAAKLSYTHRHVPVWHSQPTP